MILIIRNILLVFIGVIVFSCSSKEKAERMLFHEDIPFTQDYSVKYKLAEPGINLFSVAADRNGYIKLLSSNGLLRPRDGQFLYPGALVKDNQYQPTSDKNIRAVELYKNQFFYLDEEAVFSNSWAGEIYLKHFLPQASVFCAGDDFSFLVSDGQKIALLNESGVLWESNLPDGARDIKYDKETGSFWILGTLTLGFIESGKQDVEIIPGLRDLTCFELTGAGILAGTSGGYFVIDSESLKQKGDVINKLPCQELTTIQEIEDNVWFGSTNGAFMLREDGRFNYYASERWLPSDTVISISSGPGESVLILTSRGMSKIIFREMTLSEKADYFETQVRERHIRNGFNATVAGMSDGDVTTGRLEDSDNDGLWTSMYIAAEAFRYSVTSSESALQNVRESMEAMERLYTINPVPGFPSRSFERRGYKDDDKKWRRADDPEWDWKSTTSSDEAIGHIFAFGVIAELINDREIHDKAVMLIDTLMSHIVRNNFYLVDWNGEPTLWGRWNPEYVNARPVMVGDRKLNSSNIIAMLQTAYHFTGKEKYRDAAFNLMNEHGYLENLMRPLNEIGKAPADADDWSKMLSEGWNHSDDEMYFCGYWGLYRYALNDTLKEKYREAIIDHWSYERSEKEGLWNIMTALTGKEDIDLDEAIWYLQEYPLDLINWSVTNSNRKDITLTEPDFRGQSTLEVLPPDELRIARHNANRFDLDGRGAGKSEYSAGDIWLLPYWMGRYLGVIKEPLN